MKTSIVFDPYAIALLSLLALIAFGAWGLDLTGFEP